MVEYDLEQDSYNLSIVAMLQSKKSGISQVRRVGMVHSVVLLLITWVLQVIGLLVCEPRMFGLSKENLEWKGLSRGSEIFFQLDDMIRNAEAKTLNLARLVSVLMYVAALLAEVSDRLKCALRINNMSPALNLTTHEMLYLMAVQLTGMVIVLMAMVSGVSFIIDNDDPRDVILNATAAYFILEIDNLILGAWMTLTDTKIPDEDWTLQVPLQQTRRKSMVKMHNLTVACISVVVFLIVGIADTPFLLALRPEGVVDGVFWAMWVSVGLLTLLVASTFRFREEQEEY